jgi:hypothetical protein
MLRECLRFTFGIACVLALVPAAQAPAQSIWIPRDRDRSVTFAAAKPSLEFIDERRFSPVLTLTSRMPVSGRIWWVAEIPYAHLSIRNEGPLQPFPSESNSTVGNPYLGLEAHAGSGPFFGEIGVRAPLVGNDAAGPYLGMGSDVQFTEAFEPHVVSIEPAINLRETTGSHMAYRLRFSPTVDIPTGGDHPFPYQLIHETELFGVYAWQVGYEGPAVRVGTALSGRVLFTASYTNLGQRTVNQFEFHADAGSGAFRPGFDLRMPLGENAAAIVPVVVGLTLSWSR